LNTNYMDAANSQGVSSVGNDPNKQPLSGATLHGSLHGTGQDKYPTLQVGAYSPKAAARMQPRGVLNAN